MSQVEDRILSAFYIWLIYYESGRGPYTFRYLHHMTHLWWVYLKTVYFSSRTVYFPRRPYTFETDRILFGKDRIDFAKDRIDFAKDRIVYAGTVYFQAKTVYFQLGPYTFQDRILSNTVYFTFQDRILYNLIIFSMVMILFKKISRHRKTIQTKWNFRNSFPRHVEWFELYNLWLSPPNWSLKWSNVWQTIKISLRRMRPSTSNAGTA